MQPEIINYLGVERLEKIFLPPCFKDIRSLRSFVAIVLHKTLMGNSNKIRLKEYAEFFDTRYFVVGSSLSE